MASLRVLVIGGYGFFGRRLVERLARWPALHIVVAGRSAAHGEALVDGLRRTARASLSAAVLDVDARGFGVDLAGVNPDVVVHTSGPFQGQRYLVAEACIAAGADYIDLADGRRFVAGIGGLDDAARARGVSIISGASSVPALSDAAARTLAQGFVCVDHIDIGISPGNRTERGLATVRAILGYCGQALPDVDRAPRFGWSSSREHRYPAPVGARLLSPCDVPDLELLPQLYRGRPSISFGAGLELRLLHRGMNVMAALTHLGVVRDWSRHATVLKRVADGLQRLGSDAGAMHVSVTGETAQAVRRTRTWHLVATDGDGPFVPTLAAAALVRRLLRGDALPVGAQPCVGLLSLEDFAEEAEGLNITMTEAPTIDHPSLYEQVLGARYAELPPALQRFHRLNGHAVLHGEVHTDPPASMLARMLAWCLGTPRTASTGAIRFELDANAESETWTRHFPMRTMTSRMHVADGRLEERLGASRLTFSLSVANGTLRMRLERLRFLGIPCPRRLMPQVKAEETGSADRLHFLVLTRVPLLGVVASYRGHLNLGAEQVDG